MWKKGLSVPVLAFIVLLALTGFWGSLRAGSQSPQAAFGAIKGPEHYISEAVARPELQAQTTGDASAIRGVAIVGEVGPSTAGYTADVQGAVDALRNHGVQVDTFYYGQDTFSWPDIVTATVGANFLMYSGHGVYWSGSCTAPDLVGGFYLGPSDGRGNFGFVHPDDIRTDLAGIMADQALVLFTHACFSAGSTACDSTGTPDLAEASRRVQQYADPFMDIGMQAYYANNYFGSMTNYVNQILSMTDRPTYGDSYKSGYPYSSSTWNDLAFDATNEKWLNGLPGEWSAAFVGQASETFTADLLVPELGGLPAEVMFMYDSGTGQWLPGMTGWRLENVTTNVPITVTVDIAGGWVTATHTLVTTPATLLVEPLGAPLVDASDVMTLTVTGPDDVATRQFVIDVSLLSVEGVDVLYMPLIQR